MRNISICEFYLDTNVFDVNFNWGEYIDLETVNDIQIICLKNRYGIQYEIVVVVGTFNGTLDHTCIHDRLIAPEYDDIM